MAARTVSVMRDEIRTWVGADAKRIPNARIDNIINDIMQDISRRADLSVNARTEGLQFWQEEATDSDEWALTHTDGDTGVSYSLTNKTDLPYDFAVQQSVYLVGDDGSVTYINHMPYDDFTSNLHYFSNSGSDDSYYTIADGYVFLSFVPAYGTIVYINYFCNPDLVGEDIDGQGTSVDTSPFFVKYWDIIFQVQ